MRAARNHLRRGLTEFSRLEKSERLLVAEELLTLTKRPVYSEPFSKALIESLKKELPQPSVFLSHSSKDKRFVRALAHKLKANGIQVWVDEAEMKVGESLIYKLREAVDSVDFLIVVLSPASVASPWVQKEVEIAMNQEIKSRRVKVLPLLKETVPLPGFLVGKVYIDFRNKGARTRAINKLVSDIRAHHV
jgi:predicted nucleotide-binding protein